MAAFCVMSKEATIWQGTWSKKNRESRKDEVIQKTFVYRLGQLCIRMLLLQKVLL